MWAEVTGVAALDSDPVSGPIACINEAIAQQLDMSSGWATAA